MRELSLHRVDEVGRLPASLKGGVVAIGNFDGVHRGHQAVLERASEESRKRRCPAIVLTFEPHPRSFFKPDAPVFRLTTAPIRARLLELLGFDAVIEQCFDAGFAAQSASDFVQRVLVDGLAAAHVVTGFDFHFGKNRQGTPDFLVAAGEEAGFGVTCVEEFGDEGGDTVSSSRIRSLLQEGDVASAAALLGHRYAVEATVAGGKRLGRSLGYPTANMALPDWNGLAHGIYAVRLRRADGSLHDGVASFGLRPTVDSDGAPLLETYLFDFAGDLYGETCRVFFFGRLRGEVKFDGLDALTKQMRRDEEEARALLQGVRPLTELDRMFSFE